MAELNIKTSTRYAYLDADKLKYPLLMRFAKRVIIFTLTVCKKTKTTEKVGKRRCRNILKMKIYAFRKKEQTPILFSAEKLVWIVGHRIDDRLKVTDKTKMYLKW